MSNISVRNENGVAILTMNRPEFQNRMTTELCGELCQALDESRLNSAVCGCVLTGQGDVFCAGGDFRGAGTETEGRMEFGHIHVDLFDAMARLGKPLVAAINGNALAGGFALVMACDIAVMAEDAVVGLPEAKNGLFPFLALAIARDAMPKKLLFELIYTSRSVDAAEALRHNLVNFVVPREDVLATAVSFVEKTSFINRDIMMLGRDLYHAMRGVCPEQAMYQARFALGVALGVPYKK